MANGTAGFGCVSTPWTSFVAKPKAVSDTDVARAEAGLDATNELLESKAFKTRALEKKMQEKCQMQESLMSKMMSSIRGDADSQGRLLISVRINC